MALSTVFQGRLVPMNVMLSPPSTFRDESGAARLIAQPTVISELLGSLGMIPPEEYKTGFQYPHVGACVRVH